jgi:hypothetical protein
MHDILLAGALDSKLNYTGRLNKLYNGPVKKQNSPSEYTARAHPRYSEIRTSEITPHNMFFNGTLLDQVEERLKSNLDINYPGAPELLVKDLTAVLSDFDFNDLTMTVFCYREPESWKKSAEKHTHTPTQVKNPRRELVQMGATGDYISYAKAYKFCVAASFVNTSPDKRVLFNFDKPKESFAELQEKFGFSNSFMRYLKADFKGSRW